MKYPLYQSTLCPKLWDGDIINQDAQKALLGIVTDFVSGLKKDHDLDIDILDAVIVGSIANYNWTPYSDIDLHIITDFDKLGMSHEEGQLLFDSIKAVWNLKHTIVIKGHDVELYVQDKSYKPSSSAEYSVLNNKWLKRPSREKPKFDVAHIKAKYTEYKNKIDGLISKHDEEGLRKLLDKLYKYRQAGLDAGGELSDENIVFKAIRANGHLTRLKDAVDKLYDKKMSVKERS